MLRMENTKVSVAIPNDAFDDFNRELVAHGLLPDAIADLGPITMVIGFWMGGQLRAGVPLDLAIAEIDEVVGSPLETLLGVCTTRGQKIEMMSLKTALDSLALCCEPGRVVEATAFIVRTTMGLVDSAVAHGLSKRAPSSTPS